MFCFPALCQFQITLVLLSDLFNPCYDAETRGKKQTENYLPLQRQETTENYKIMGVKNKQPI